MDNLFGRAIKTAIDQHIIRGVDIALEFEVPWSTIDRWIQGTTVPHPVLQNQIINYVQTRIDEVQASAWARMKNVDWARGAMLDYKENK